MKKIDTIVEDMYALMGSGVEVSKEAIDNLSVSISKHITNSLVPRLSPSTSLRASSLGKSCDRASWYQENTPEKEESVEPWTQLKFLFGHIHEELLLFLAEQSGHKVTHRQDTITYNGIEGHPDAKIDGVVTDVKSANSRGMSKFRTNNLRSDDPFGYLAQLSFYFNGLLDEEDTDKKEVAFLVADKELGHIVLDKYTSKELPNINEIIEHKKCIVALKSPPPRGFFDQEDGKSGNRMLCTECKYCPYKKECWPGLRKFIYSNGPRWLTHVAKQPDVKEEI